MNGPRSNMPRNGDRSSLDALNKTIEGLEARIEGLMGNTGRQSHGQQQGNYEQNTGNSEQLSEIFNRQKMLDEGRRGQQPSPARSLTEEIRERLRSNAPSSPARPQQQTRQAAPAPRYEEQRPQKPVHEAFDIAEALVNLRADLKRDISESLGHEISDLRREIREIGGMASEQGLATEIHGDMQRLAESIEHLSRNSGDAAARSLQDEFDSMRALLGGLARHEDIHELSRNLPQASGLGSDGEIIRAEILQLAERLEDFKSQFQNGGNEPAIRALENKLVKIAEAMEMFASQMPDYSRDFGHHMNALDQRLNEIATAMEAYSNEASQQNQDAGFSALEQRISHLGSQIEAMASQPQWEAELTGRIDRLSQRIEELSYNQSASRLDQRLEELASMLTNIREPAAQPELTGFLNDISRKIDALDQNSVDGQLADRFEALARRIDQLELSPQPANDVFARLEERMQGIAARLDEASAPQTTHSAVDLSGLEAQISNLTALMNQPQANTGGDFSGMENRMSALEDYMATNDEYIVEAARQAAEAAVDAYTRNFSGHIASSEGSAPADLSVISDLAADLRALEDLTRSGEARNQRTFEALQDTLLKIAERLDSMSRAPAAPTYAEQTDHYAEEEQPAAFGRKNASYDDTAEPVASQVSETAVRYDESALEDSPELMTALHEDHEDRGDGLSEAEGGKGDNGGKSKSLLGALSKKLMPGRKDDDGKAGRTLIEPTPDLDAADTISPEFANQLLEPGSGAPDIRKILEKVRASQETDIRDPGKKFREDEDNADYIAAARRAAQAAAAEMETQGDQAGAKNTDSLIGRYRRPLLLAVGAVLLAVMAYPLANTLMHKTTSSEPAQPAALTDLAKPTAAKPQTSQDKAPAVRDVTPAPAKASGADSSQKEPDNGAGAADSKTTPDAVINTPDAKATGDNTSVAPAATTSQNTASADNAAPTTAVASPVIPKGTGPKALIDAVGKNDPLAMFEVGSRLTEGRGVSPDAKAAIAWYEKAANLGFAPAEYRLGNIYEKGLGTAKNLEKAKSYYLSAANAGNISAMHNLAVLYATGEGSAPDFESAAKWFEAAANHGVRDSQFNLAILYAKGSGVKQDLQQSYKWFGIAAKSGDKDAAQKRDEIGKVLNDTQLNSAKQTINNWKLTPPDEAANSTTVPDAWVGKGGSTSSVDMKKAIRNIQAILDKNGFDAGKPDGVMGAKTIAAIKSFQSSVGQKPTGEINEALVRELLARNK